MRFYTKQHKAYCGIDLHVRTMYLCILHQDGEILLHRNLQTSPDMFLKAIAPYREDLVVAVACTIVQTAKQHDAQTVYRLQSVPGIGQNFAFSAALRDA